jgi:hypothetical protein
MEIEVPRPGSSAQEAPRARPAAAPPSWPKPPATTREACPGTPPRPPEHRHRHDAACSGAAAPASTRRSVDRRPHPSGSPHQRCHQRDHPCHIRQQDPPPPRRRPAAAAADGSRGEGASLAAARVSPGVA